MSHTLGSACSILTPQLIVLVDKGVEGLVGGVCIRGRIVVPLRRFWVIESTAGGRVLVVGSPASDLEDEADDNGSKQKTS